MTAQEVITEAKRRLKVKFFIDANGNAVLRSIKTYDNWHKLTASVFSALPNQYFFDKEFKKWVAEFYRWVYFCACPYFGKEKMKCDQLTWFMTIHHAMIYADEMYTNDELVNHETSRQLANNLK